MGAASPQTRGRGFPFWAASVVSSIWDQNPRLGSRALPSDSPSWSLSSFLSHLRQQRLQLISQPNNVFRVMSRPPSSRRMQAKYGGGCPAESLSDIAAEYEFGAQRVVDRVNRSACDTPVVDLVEHCSQVIDGLDSETQRRGFLRLPLGADREHKAGDRHR